MAQRNDTSHPGSTIAAVFFVILCIVLALFFPEIEGFLSCKEYSLAFMFCFFVIILPYLFLGFLYRGTQAIHTKKITIPLYKKKNITLSGFKARAFGAFLILLDITIIPYLYITVIPYIYTRSCPPVDFLWDVWYFFMPI